MRRRNLLSACCTAGKSFEKGATEAHIFLPSGGEKGRKKRKKAHSFHFPRGWKKVEILRSRIGLLATKNNAANRKGDDFSFSPLDCRARKGEGKRGRRKEGSSLFNPAAVNGEKEGGGNKKGKISNALRREGGTVTKGQGK